MVLGIGAWDDTILCEYDRDSMVLGIGAWDDTLLCEYDRDREEVARLSVREADIASGTDTDGSSGRRWEDMDRDCLINIFARVPTPDLLMSVPLVCKTWHRASLNPHCWTSLDFREVFSDDDDCEPSSLSGVLKFAASRSQGHATALLMPTWRCGYDPQDLDFITDALKGLRVLVCGRVTEETTQFRLAQVIDKWTDLECLSIGEDQPGLAQALTAVARGCPRFQQLHLFDMELSHEAATTIAEGFAPRLTYLRLVDVSIRKEDLLSILRACKSLRTLHISDCGGLGNDDDPDVLECGTRVQKFFYRSQSDSFSDDYRNERIGDAYEGNSDDGYYYV